MKKIILFSVIFYVLSLIVSKQLLTDEIINHDTRAALSLHVFVGLMMYNLLYYGIKSCVDPKWNRYKIFLILTVWVSLGAIAFVDWIIIPNWKLAFLIQFITLFSFGFWYLFFRKIPLLDK